tara:strand:+ start:174 stop:575 length:402 start_codon:yes stop_codon:yes gene_type:complete
MKKMTRISGVTLAVALMLSLNSCYNDKVIDKEIEENVSFSADIQPILNNNCVVCHSVGAVNQVPYWTADVSYDTVLDLIEEGGIVPFDAAGSELMEMLNYDENSDNPMPPEGKMAAINISLFEAWINQGALNN